MSVCLERLVPHQAITNSVTKGWWQVAKAGGRIQKTAALASTKYVIHRVMKSRPPWRVRILDPASGVEKIARFHELQGGI